MSQLWQSLRSAIAALVIAFIGFSSLIYIFLISFPLFECENKIAAFYPSPDERKKLMVFERNCGATTDFVTHILLADFQDKLSNDSVGNILIAKGSSQTLEIEFEWLNATSVKLISGPNKIRGLQMLGVTFE